jgi:hypothetical protein
MYYADISPVRGGRAEGDAFSPMPRVAAAASPRGMLHQTRSRAVTGAVFCSTTHFANMFTVGCRGASASIGRSLSLLPVSPSRPRGTRQRASVSQSPKRGSPRHALSPRRHLHSHGSPRDVPLAQAAVTRHADSDLLILDGHAPGETDAAAEASIPSPKRDSRPRRGRICRPWMMRPVQQFAPERIARSTSLPSICVHKSSELTLVDGPWW